MTDKLTDNEIIIALEICCTKGASCKGCPAFVKVDRSKCKEVLVGALDIINRLKLQNKDLSEEKLKKEVISVNTLEEREI